jgi:hypothetical protein
MLQYQPRHQADQRFSRILRQVGPLGRAARYLGCEQIHPLGSEVLLAPIPYRLRRGLPCHGSLLDSDRERSQMRWEAGYSMIAP